VHLLRRYFRLNLQYLVHQQNRYQLDQLHLQDLLHQQDRLFLQDLELHLPHLLP
jgi:hypothetical protein